MKYYNFGLLIFWEDCSLIFVDQFTIKVYEVDANARLKSTPTTLCSVSFYYSFTHIRTHRQNNFSNQQPNVCKFRIKVYKVDTNARLKSTPPALCPVSCI